MASEDGELFKQMREDQQKRRSDRLPIRQSEILALVNEGYDVKELTPYQFRINGIIDLYPIHNRWHNIKTGKRGGVKNLADFIRQTLKL